MKQGNTFPLEDQGTNIGVIPDMREWKTYRSEEAGFSFKYPDIFQRVDIGIRNNAGIANDYSGRSINGLLEFAPNHGISFGGVTKDYRAPKGGNITGTNGYEEKDGKFYLTFIWGKNEVVPSEFWPVNGGTEQALVVRGTGSSSILTVGAIAAVVNIPHSPFPGIVFETSAPRQGMAVNEREINLLRQIVSTITFE